MSYTSIIKERITIRNSNESTDDLIKRIWSYLSDNIAEEVSYGMSLDVEKMHSYRDEFEMQLSYEGTFNTESCIGVDYFLPVLKKLNESGDLDDTVSYQCMEYVEDTVGFCVSGFSGGNEVSYEYTDDRSVTRDVSVWFADSFTIFFEDLNGKDQETCERAEAHLRDFLDAYLDERDIKNTEIEKYDEENGCIGLTVQLCHDDITVIADALKKEVLFAEANGLGINISAKFISIDDHSMAIADLSTENGQIIERYLNI